MRHCLRLLTLLALAACVTDPVPAQTPIPVPYDSVGTVTHDSLIRVTHDTVYRRFRDSFPPPVDTVKPPAPGGSIREVFAGSVASILSKGYATAENKATGRMAIDYGVTAPGGGPSLRYDIPAGSGCKAGATIARALAIPAGAREVWLEWSLRFPVGFQSGNRACAGGLHSQKTVLLYYNVDARVQYVTGIYTSHQPLFGWGGSPAPNETQVPNVRTGCKVASCYDGQWHTYRMHVRLSSSMSKQDGLVEFWVDGVKQVSRDAATFSVREGRAATGFRWVLLGSNRNSPPDTPQSYWWGPATVYTSSPGWP